MVIFVHGVAIPTVGWCLGWVDKVVEGGMERWCRSLGGSGLVVGVVV